MRKAFDASQALQVLPSQVADFFRDKLGIIPPRGECWTVQAVEEAAGFPGSSDPERALLNALLVYFAQALPVWIVGVERTKRVCLAASAVQYAASGVWVDFGRCHTQAIHKVRCEMIALQNAYPGSFLLPHVVALFCHRFGMVHKPSKAWTDLEAIPFEDGFANSQRDELVKAEEELALLMDAVRSKTNRISSLLGADLKEK